MGASGIGPLDSVRTGRAGEFSLTIRERDTTAQYVVAVRHAGVGYLTPPVTPRGSASRRLDTLVVYDSSSTQPVSLSQRHLLVQPPNPDGSIPVLELLVLRNEGPRTRVPRDTVTPTWRARLLEGATGAEVGETDLAHEMIEHEGDSIVVRGPITPGDKQVVLTYLLPRGRRVLHLPVDDTVATLGIMLADTLAIAPPVLESYGVSSFENIQYLRLEAKEVAPGTPIDLRLVGRAPQPGELWWLVVAVATLGMAAALVAWWRADRARGGFSDAELLALQLAALNATGDPGHAPRRAELESRLTATLARKPSPS